MDDKSKAAFASRVEDMCVLALKRRKPVCTSFLNDVEQFDAQRILTKRKDVSFEFWGGHKACVRKMLKVFTDEWQSGAENEEYQIYPLTLSFRREDKPGHRDFLGSFMGLGIKRETIGDIFVGDGVAVVFCTKTARDMISNGLTAVGRVGVSISDGIAEDAESIILPPRVEKLSVNVASHRADCIVAGITGLARDKATGLIRSGSFLVNYSECDNISRNVSEGDILTIRGYGKFVVGADDGITNKGRIKLTVKKYI